MMTEIFLETVHGNGAVERFEPYKYSCGQYQRGGSTRSNEKMLPEPTLHSLGAWILDRRLNGQPGGVRMKSLTTGKAGLRTIAKIVVR